jgi:hypothetical protein
VSGVRASRLQDDASSSARVSGSHGAGGASLGRGGTLAGSAKHRLSMLSPRGTPRSTPPEKER